VIHPIIHFLASDLLAFLVAIHSRAELRREPIENSREALMISAADDR
jgi:hypothetical protein